MHALEAYTVVALRHAAAAPARRAAAVPGREPVLRPAVRARDRARRPQSPHCRRRRQRHRGAHGDGARVDDRRHRVLAARASTSRTRSPIRSPRCKHEWTAAGIRRRGARPARLRGRRDGAGRVPVHRGRGTGAVRDRGAAPRRRRRPRRLARAPDRRTSARRRGCARSDTARTTSRRSSRARSTSAGSSSAPRRRSARPSSRSC